MKCDLPFELLSTYLDGELDEAQRAHVEAHLKSCPICQEELEALQRIEERVKTRVFQEPSREFSFGLNRRIMDKIRIAPRRNIFRFTPIFVPIAAACLILIIITNISPSGRIVGMADRMPYEEVTARQALPVSVPKPEVAAAPQSQKITPRAVAGTAAPAELEEAPSAEAITRYDAEEFKAIITPREQVVRAIIDTSGTIIKVATGNTLVPQKDTMLEKELSGQQLSPPMIAGKKKQIYVDVAALEKGDE